MDAGNFIEAAIEISGEKIHRIFAYHEMIPDMDYGDCRIIPGL